MVPRATLIVVLHNVFLRFWLEFDLAALLALRVLQDYVLMGIAAITRRTVSLGIFMDFVFRATMVIKAGMKAT